MLIEIPVSLGELVDKITILEIKASRFEGDALNNVTRELKLLEQTLLDCRAEVSSGSSLVEEKGYAAY